MPTYFQSLQYANNIDMSVRGCTSGTITSDGKAPADTSSKCTIYNTQKDDLEKVDSCTNVKRLESTKCFPHTVNGVSKILKPNKLGSPYIECTFSQTESVFKGTETDAVVPGLVDQFWIMKDGNFNGDSYMNISQIIVRNINGQDITNQCTVNTSPASFGTNAAFLKMGNGAPRPYPFIYHSESTLANPKAFINFNLPTPTELSSISIINRADCCMDRLPNFGIWINRIGIGWIARPFTSAPVQTIMIPRNVATSHDIFTPESVTYTCNELESYKSWIDSIKTLYPDMYEKSKQNLDSSETWSDDKKNTFCNILEQTKIEKTLTADKLKQLAVL